MKFKKNEDEEMSSLEDDSTVENVISIDAYSRKKEPWGDSSTQRSFQKYPPSLSSSRQTQIARLEQQGLNQLSVASILLESATYETLEDVPFLFDVSPQADAPYTRVRFPSHWLKRALLVLYVAQLALSVFFLRWLLTNGWNDKSQATSALFVMAEIVAFISTNMFLFNGLLGLCPLRVKKVAEDPGEESTQDVNDTSNHEEVTDFFMETIPEDLEVEFKGEDGLPTVAVCVCRYKEPIEDLLLTVHTMDRIHWPASKLQLFILDDGWHLRDRPYQMELAVRLSDICGVNEPMNGPPDVKSTKECYRQDCATDCSYWVVREASDMKPSVTLIARQKPSVSHYKAGNLNNFLYNYLGDAAERDSNIPQYMVMLDHDMLPHPDFVSDAMSRFEEDSSLAFVQYPQRFYDIKGSDLLYAGNEIFFDGVQINRDSVGLTAFAGTNAMWSLQSLYHVGGFQYGSLTEDANTGLAVNIAGYTSAYSRRELAVGQSPQTVEDAMQQRMRWSQGAIEMLVHHTKCIFTRKSPFQSFELPGKLGEMFASKAVHPPRLWKKIVMCFVFFDSMVYPLYSVGFLLHVLVCVLYLYNAEAPMAPQNPTEVLQYWLPLYIVKASCQVFAFPAVSLATQWNSQMAWAGYSFSTLASIRKGLFSGGGWFNTGAAKKDRFWLQYGNTAAAIAIYIMMLYRAMAFVAFDKTCTAWTTAGALLYGLVMLAHVRDWAMEPFRHVSTEDHGNVSMLRDSVTQQSSMQGDLNESAEVHAKAIRQSEMNRKDNSLDMSILFILVHVILVSFLLFFWASGNCDFRGGLVFPVTPAVVNTTLANYCNFNNCNGLVQGGDDCNAGQEECMGCGGQWCTMFIDNATTPSSFNSSGVASTTRYWDCVGGACGCGFIGNFSTEPVHCYSNSPFAAPPGNPYGAVLYGAAAISETLGGSSWMGEACGKCWKLTGQSNIPARPNFSSSIVVKGTNFCPPSNDVCNGKDHFDIAGKRSCCVTGVR